MSLAAPVEPSEAVGIGIGVTGLLATSTRLLLSSVGLLTTGDPMLLATSTGSSPAWPGLRDTASSAVSSIFVQEESMGLSTFSSSLRVEVTVPIFGTESTCCCHFTSPSVSSTRVVAVISSNSLGSGSKMASDTGASLLSSFLT